MRECACGDLGSSFQYGGMRGRFCLYLYIRGVGVGGLVRGSVRGISVKRFGALMDCE